MNISVVIPMYNKEQSINKTISSILDQDYKFPFEVVVVDDGSTDDSVQCVLEIQDDRVRLIRKKNGGESDARNIGILNSRYESVAFLDADDLWESDFLSTVYNLSTKYPAAEVFCTKYARVKENHYDEPVHSIWNERHGLIDNYFEQVNETLGDMILTSSSVCIKKSAISKVGLFYFGDKLGADQDYWYRIFSKDVVVAFSNKVCALYILDETERVCDNYKRFQELKFIKRRFNHKSPISQKRYLANARIGAINDVFNSGNKTKAILSIVKELPMLVYATPKRLVASIIKVLK
ncbi:glycosyltransferase family 2 protein [Vibrio parahaemolyticus]|uniref:glycosyltransferase family 2 protein n=1 Tax=Vibrio harveyi TaxID=669 RepID=UPI000AF64486|nr:glycosyltransferase family A protein [Vibrio harveyi]EGQ8703154.1 glycosyltransferase [Vibrio parahaemolyticus]EJC7184299.1 glycosyltransferase family 2 protein [Vibrio parahaemolyticus]EJG0452175.1 glycosyltransferase family 2 protein [Vibrio parahaemolyticus]EJG0461016.1 glycosyltransferase family 2 protein [Vibrio parahaemolyticus]EKN4677887.1 glycosyltransferase family 2 protein [Vibrio parahaemolyticus]